MRKLLLALGFLLASWSAQAAPQGIIPCSAQTISVSNSSSSVQLSNCGGTVLLWNISSQEVFYTWGLAPNTAATTSSYSLPGNSFVVLNLGLAQYYLAAITGSSTSTLRITQGVAQ